MVKIRASQNLTLGKNEEIIDLKITLNYVFVLINNS
jgi:hypothetical protein